MQMVNVRLVADRPNHKDLLYGTNIEWDSQGAVRPVPEPAWQRMKVHADVYELAPETQKPAGAATGPTLADSSPGVSDLTIPRLGAVASTPLTATEVKAAIPGPEVDPIADVAKEGLRPLSPDMLAQIDDAAVHAEIERRGYTVGKSFTGPRLRERFLAEQAKRV